MVTSSQRKPLTAVSEGSAAHRPRTTAAKERFPAAKNRGTEIEPRLVQAADLIGQLGDPMYTRKANALYHEFEEIGMKHYDR